ncbi:hypothetical protein [Dyella sp. 20L07]|uniref:hypothetical protein n=1 Tax=Dyella sp. 20L07 TaxID=3384240 RepID=UPI003D2E8A5E
MNVQKVLASGMILGGVLLLMCAPTAARAAMLVAKPAVADGGTSRISGPLQYGTLEAIIKAILHQNTDAKDSGNQSGTGLDHPDRSN